MWKTPEEMQAAIDEYFENPKTRTMVVGGNTVDVPVITITGLCLHLGFCSRQSFYDYELKEEFAYTIKRARTMIECEYESALHAGSPAGAIFALKNFGWKDKTEVEQNTTHSVSKPLAEMLTGGSKR